MITMIKCRPAPAPENRLLGLTPDGSQLPVHHLSDDGDDDVYDDDDVIMMMMMMMMMMRLTSPHWWKSLPACSWSRPPEINSSTFNLNKSLNWQTCWILSRFDIKQSFWNGFQKGAKHGAQNNQDLDQPFGAPGTMEGCLPPRMSRKLGTWESKCSIHLLKMLRIFQMKAFRNSICFHRGTSSF